MRLTPRSRAGKIAGITTGADGKPVLKAAVTAVPERGQANAALIALLAKAWRLPKSSMAVTSGQTSRQKTVTIAGDPKTLMPYLTEWARKLDD